jgi:hypothetical protein
MLLRYFLNDCEMVPVAPIITGIIFVFTFHMCYISIVRSLYYKIIIIIQSFSFLLNPFDVTKVHVYTWHMQYISLSLWVLYSIYFNPSF